MQRRMIINNISYYADFFAHIDDTNSSTYFNEGDILSVSDLEQLGAYGRSYLSHMETMKYFEELFIEYIQDNGYDTKDELILMGIDGCPKCLAIIGFYASSRDSLKAGTYDVTTIQAWWDGLSQPDLSSY